MYRQIDPERIVPQSRAGEKGVIGVINGGSPVALLSGFALTHLCSPPARVALSTAIAQARSGTPGVTRLTVSTLLDPPCVARASGGASHVPAS